MTRTDRNGNRVNELGIPAGPVDADPADAYHGDGEFKGAASQEVILRDTLLRAGVELGSHDERIVRWLSEVADWSTFATVASWIERADRARSTGTPPSPAP